VFCAAGVPLRLLSLPRDRAIFLIWFPVFGFSIDDTLHDLAGCSLWGKTLPGFLDEVGFYPIDGGKQKSDNAGVFMVRHQIG
jgi:hypothetical protein